MAEDTTTTESAASAAPPEQSTPTMVIMAQPTGPAAPRKGIDETVEGGAYRIEDGRGTLVRWVNANGDEIKAPKGK